MTDFLAARLFAAVLAATALAAPAGAEERRLPAGRADLQLSFAPVVAQAVPAVVNIYATRVVQQRRPAIFDDPLFQRFFGEPGQDQPSERLQRSLGSGVIVAPEGLVVTNHHVIEDMTEVRVALADRREFEAEILLTDKRTDLAVLKIKGAAEKFPVLPLADSDEILVGDLVLAIGNPFGVGQTVTSGIVSALARTQVGISDFRFFIQTDAAINPGNSGGALVDLNGRLVGINTAIFSRSGGSIGIGFAIPANMLKVVVASARAGSSVVRRPWFGARGQPMTAEIAETLGLPRPTGVLVADVAKGSPAERGGLKTGDVVTAVDGQVVDDVDSLTYRLGTRPIGGQVKLAALRGGKPLQLTIALEAAPEIPPRDLVLLAGRSPLTGASVANLSPALVEELALDLPSEGVVVMDVAAGSIAGRVGFQRGDVVVSINDVEVKASRELDKLVRLQPRTWRITIRRGEQVLTTMLGG
jgi:Do/DeqQ family serine protease